jgi:plastocyanin
LVALAGFLLARPAVADSASVTIQNFAFSPTPLTVPIGSTVTWTNQDSTSHTTTSDDGSAVSWSSPALSKGGTYSVTFTQTGTFTYHCAIHPYMQGTIVVQAAGATSVPTSAPTNAPTSNPSPTATLAPTAVSTTAPPTAVPTQKPAKKGTKTIAARPKGQTYIFSPSSTTVKVGTRVIWVNSSAAIHTVTSKVKGWKFNKNLNKSQVSYTFKKAGTYLYHCKFHPGMVGKIVVKKG